MPHNFLCMSVILYKKLVDIEIDNMTPPKDMVIFLVGNSCDLFDVTSSCVISIVFAYYINKIPI